MSFEFLYADRATQQVESCVSSWTEKYVFTPGVHILLWLTILFILSSDMHIMFLLPPTLSSSQTYGTTQNVRSRVDYTPNIFVLIWFPLMFLLSLDVHIIFLLSPTLLSCDSITNTLDWNVLSGDELVIESCSLEFVKTCVMRFVLSGVLPCHMIPMTDESKRSDSDW